MIKFHSQTKFLKVSCEMENWHGKVYIEMRIMNHVPTRLPITYAFWLNLIFKLIVLFDFISFCVNSFEEIIMHMSISAYTKFLL